MKPTHKADKADLVMGRELLRRVIQAAKRLSKEDKAKAWEELDRSLGLKKD
jgi:hypothetical protein